MLGAQIKEVLQTGLGSKENFPMGYGNFHLKLYVIVLRTPLEKFILCKIFELPFAFGATSPAKSSPDILNTILFIVAI